MRARLVDLGEVGPIRSQSAYHAVLARLGDADDPVVLLARPAAALLSVGRPASDRDALMLQLDRTVPRVRSRLGGPNEVLDENDLLIQIVIPALSAPSDAVETARRSVLETLSHLGIEVTQGRDGGLETVVGRVGRIHGACVDAALCIACHLTWGDARSEIERPGTGSLAALLDEPPCLADLAELQLAAIERDFKLELFPSLPTPEELAAIYDWDDRLRIDAVDDASHTQTVTATSR